MNTRSISRAVVARTLCALCALFVTFPASAQPGGVPCAPGQVVVRLVEGHDIDELNGLGCDVLDGLADDRTFLLGIPPGLSECLAAAILNMVPVVECAEPNFAVVLEGATGSFFVSLDQEDYLDQYGPGLIEVVPVTSQGTVRVAVLDTGVDAGHVELQGAVVSGGYDFVDLDGDPDDSANGIDDDLDGDVDEMVGHGTHLSGLIRLVAPDAEILPVRVLSDDGTGFAFEVARGVDHAVANGAHVINMSFSSPVDSVILGNAVAAAETAGVVVVAAVGNDDEDDPVTYPAAYSTTIAVAGTDDADRKTTVSNYGTYVTISAPGEAMAGPLPGDAYGGADGSSFSAALVSGAAALLLAQEPGASTGDVKSWLTGGADDIDGLNPSFAGLLGAGRLNVDAALELAEGS